MSEQLHKIKRQVFELSASSLELARSVQDRTGRMCSARIAPIVESACGDVSPPDRVHRIERLVVELGPIAANDFESELCGKLAAGLRRALRDELQARPAQDGALVSALELFVQFARSGTLPWWADAARPGLLAGNARELIRGAPNELAEAMRELAGHGEALRRLSVSHEDGLLAELCALLAPGLEARAAAVVAAALRMRLERTALGAGLAAAGRRSIAWQCLLRLAALPSAARELQAMAVEAAHSLDFAAALPEAPERIAAAADALERRAADPPGLFAAEAQRRSDLGDSPLKAAPPVPADARPQASAMRAGNERSGNERRGADAAAGRRRDVAAGLDAALRDTLAASGRPAANTSPPTYQSEPCFSDAEEVYLDCAGLVLLWPFLRGLFRRLELCDGDSFRDDGARRRAVAVLHHLAFAEPASGEYKLALAKVLCGLEITDLVEPGEPLTEAEREECVSCLGAVIDAAPILDGMSIAAFRATFLLRRGALSAQDGAWLLRVERESYDVVLDHLPWGLEWASLPWMEAPLRVVWR